MTDISVVIPTYNRLRFLQKAIPMYLKYSEVKEVIIVIDGSWDGSLEYVKAISAEDRRIRYIDNGVNKGLPCSRNIGIAAARCPLVFSTEDDLEIVGNFFETLITHMAEANADVIAARNIFRPEDETLDEAIYRADQIPGPVVDMRSIEVATGARIERDQHQLLIASPMLASADLFRRIRFDDRYEVNGYREDSDFQLSAQECGYTIVSCPHALSFNFFVKDDKGGVHTARRLKYVRWVIRNNWRFVKKHRVFIKHHFEIGNPYLYITRYATKWIVAEIALPYFAAARKRLARAVPF